MSTSGVPPEEAFIPARSRRKKRKFVTGSHDPRVSFATRLQNATSSLADSEWIKGCQKKVEICLQKLGWEPPELLCLGLGSPTQSGNAAAQLALVVSICHHLEIASDSVSFFDPYFTQEDIDGLLEMKFRVLSENKRGKYLLQRRTLLVMPHCGLELYENILRENWGVGTLHYLLLLGNVLQDYATATPAAKLEREAPCISRLWKHLVCDPISPFELFPYAFNNLGIQYVCLDTLPERGDDMWNLPLPISDKTSREEIV